MKLKNTCKGAIWIKGIKINPQDTKEVPITRPEVMASELRTKVEIIKDNKKSVPIEKAAKKTRSRKKWLVKSKIN